MKRIQKALLSPVRYTARKLNHYRIYYWSDERLRKLSTITVMPLSYYRWLHTICLKMAESRALQKYADKLIHTIPLKVRFDVA